jgi:PEP-CTERM motif
MRNAIKTLLGTTALAIASAAAAAPVSGQGTWETTLQARDLDGNGTTDAYYDTALNISWLADANVIGLANFDTAASWASGLNVAGVGGWHLPTIKIDSCGTDGLGASFWNGGGVCGYNVQANTSDMAHMYMTTLANPSYSGFVDRYGNGPGLSAPLLENSGPFSNLQAFGYWFAQDHAVDPWTGVSNTGEAWRYSFYAGRQDNLSKNEQGGLYAWAVHDGDVGNITAAVPEPETYALMLAGLAMMVPLARRRRQHADAGSQR